MQAKRNGRRRWLAITAAWLLLPLTTASAVTFTVDDTSDLPDVNLADVLCAASNGKCTLRAAVQEANDTPGQDTIAIPDGDYLLAIPGTGENAAATGDLDLTSDVIVSGAGANLVTVSGQNLDRVFHVLPGGVASIDGLTITGGFAIEGLSPIAAGGGVFNQGNLSLKRCELTDNAADVGPGFGFGGGLASTGTLTVDDTAILQNHICTGGVALYCFGGGAYVYSGTFTNVTIAANDAPMVASPIGGIGGGLYAAGAVTLRSTTIAANSAYFNGGLLLNASGTTLRNSIVAGNADTQGRPDCDGTVTSEGYNLIQDPAGCTIIGDPTGVQTGVDPLLLGPSDEGGGTRVYVLGTGSPAIDAGNPAAPGSGGMACPARDQRGYPRGFGGAACDLGAAEVGTCPPEPDPPAACRQLIAPNKGLLLLKDNAVDAKDVLKSKWIKGQSTLDAELGNGTLDYGLCIYDSTGLVAQERIPGGGSCGANPCWTDTPTGLRYKDPAASGDGIKVLKAKAGIDGKTAMVVIGKGAGLKFTPPPWSGTVVVQTNSVGICWSASYTATIRNENGFYKARP